MRLNSNSTLTPADIRSFMQAQPALQRIPQNIVYDSWKTGITAFYQRQYAQAYSAFQQASKTNPQFQGAILFAQLAQQNASNTSAHSTSVGGFKLHNVLLPYWLLSIVGLIFLALLLLIITLLFGRSYQERRRFKRDLDEARRRAAIEAPRLKEQEISQRDALSQQPTLLPIEPSATAFAPVAPTPTPAPVPSPATPRSGPLTMEQLCPRCNEPVAPGSRFCGNCRLPLPGAAANKRQSGLLSVFSAQPMDSIVNQPTLDMSSSIPPTNGTVDPEETEPQLKPTLPHKYPGLLVVTRTNPGIKRQYKPNEDNLFAGKVLREVNGDLVPCALLVVADGMGGHANGQDASRIAIQTIIDYMLPRLLKGGELSSEDYKQLMLDGVQRANQAVHQGNVDSHGDMGTTMTGSLIVGTTAYVANVGDSRTYLYRQSDGLSKVTQDHSVVASLVSAGIIKPDDIYTHPKRNQIYRSLGERENVEIDPFVVQLQPDDKLLLCSDGLWDMVRDPLIEGVIKQNSSDLDKTADGLIKAALAGGGEDNVSVIVAHIAEAAPSPGKPGFQLVYKPDSVPLPDF